MQLVRFKTLKFVHHHFFLIHTPPTSRFALKKPYSSSQLPQNKFAMLILISYSYLSRLFLLFKKERFCLIYPKSAFDNPAQTKEITGWVLTAPSHGQ
jgi:hypothetical protein